MTRFSFSWILAMIIGGSFLVVSAFDTTISIHADIPSGTYDHALQIHLSASSVSSEPVKISWTKNPNGSPADAHMYHEPIEVFSNTHLLFFAFSDPANATLMDDRQYDIHYPQTLSFDWSKISIASGSTITGEVKLRNNGNTPIDLSRWKVATDSDAYIFPWGVMVSGGQTVTVHSLQFKDPSIWIESPDGVEVVRIAISYRVAQVPILQKKPIWVAFVSSLPKQINIPISWASGSLWTGFLIHSSDTGSRLTAFSQSNPGHDFSDPFTWPAKNPSQSFSMITSSSALDSNGWAGSGSRPTVSLAASVDNTSGGNLTQTIFIVFLCLLLAGWVYGVSFFLREQERVGAPKSKHK